MSHEETAEQKIVRTQEWLPTLVAVVAIILIGEQSGNAGVLVGTAGAGVLLVAHSRLGAPYSVAVGHVALVAVLGGSGGAVLWFAEAALLAMLVVPDAGSRRDRRIGAMTVVLAATLLTATWGAQTTWQRLWASATTLAVIGTLIGYGLHRFERVQRGAITRE